VLSSVRNQFIKVLVTSFTQILNGLSISLQVVIDFEALIVFFKLLQFLEEWQIFSWILCFGIAKIQTPSGL
jgi:hypothetical protein